MFVHDSVYCTVREYRAQYEEQLNREILGGNDNNDERRVFSLSISKSQKSLRRSGLELGRRQEFMH